MGFSTYYTLTQLSYIAFSGLSLVVAMILFKRGNSTASVLFLLLAAFFLRYLSISIDPFLHMWDEQYHALVAKNLSKNMLKPVLYENTYLGYDYTNWGGNHIWVHKQPWFLWQMALSIKVFGVNEIAVRIPSMLMSILMVLLVYRIGSLVCNKEVGWYSAFLCVVCYFQTEVVSGTFPTDHNDIAFMFYVSASIWAFFEYMQSSRKTFWMALIGLLAGIAVLNKWLVGLTVFSGWFFYLITDKNELKNLKNWGHLTASFFIAVAVAIPWQLYIFSAFPLESGYEMEFASRHFGETIEGHGGDAWFHLDKLSFIYGKLAPFFIVPGLIAVYRHATKKRWLPFYFFLLIVYLFYTLAQTKMQLFSLCVASLVFVLFGAFLHAAMNWVEGIASKRLYYFLWYIAIIVIGIIDMNTDELERKHSVRFDKNFFTRSIRAAYEDKKAALILKDGNYAVFNADPHFLPAFCFYSGQMGYPGFPSKEHYELLKREKIKMAVFDSPWVPDYIRNDKHVLILPKNFLWVVE